MSGPSIINQQRDVVINRIKAITRDQQWMLLILDEYTKKLLDNLVKDEEILAHKIANIDRIENKREATPSMEAIYVLSPQPHIVQCVAIDLQRSWYRRSHLIWTSACAGGVLRPLGPYEHKFVGHLPMLVDYYAAESRLVTFRDKSSFPLLYHPACNSLVPAHIATLAQKIAAVCITIGELPNIRFFWPPNPTHDASVLSSMLAEEVQKELLEYQQVDPNFPPPSTRPPSILIITDRAMDLVGPLVHEFTYQAMVHDVLPIKDDERSTFHLVTNPRTPEAEAKDVELTDKDDVWVKNRHLHMKDTIDKLQGDFQKFMAQNPNFANDGNNTSLNSIRNMLANLPQFQEMKGAYSLHISMAQDAMAIFESQKLPDVGAVEQTLATGLDEDGKKAKGVLEQVVELLDDEATSVLDRLRLVVLYLLYRNGVISDDVDRLIAHAGLASTDSAVAKNLAKLGADPIKATVKEVRQPRTPLPFGTRNPAIKKALASNPNLKAADDEGYSLSRFQTAMKEMLNDVCHGYLDQALFPYLNPPPDANSDPAVIASQQGSLRTQAPKWASANRRQVENRQRILVYMAGGATYAEARACYEAAEKYSRDIYLITSHMVTPKTFVRQLADLSASRSRLHLPMDGPRPQVPAHLLQPPPPPPGTQQQQQQQQQGRLGPPGASLAPGGQRRPGPVSPGMPRPPMPPTGQMSSISLSSNGSSSTAGGATGSNGGHSDDGAAKKKRGLFKGLRKH